MQTFVTNDAFINPICIEESSIDETNEHGEWNSTIVGHLVVHDLYATCAKHYYARGIVNPYHVIWTSGGYQTTLIWTQSVCHWLWLLLGRYIYLCVYTHTHTYMGLAKIIKLYVRLVAPFTCSILRLPNERWPVGHRQRNYPFMLDSMWSRHIYLSIYLSIHPLILTCWYCVSKKKTTFGHWPCAQYNDISLGELESSQHTWEC